MTTISQLKELSNEELRVRVATAIGWRRRDGEEPTYGGTYLQSGWFAPDGEFHRGYIREKAEGLPLFESSLDAISEAEKTLSDEEHWKFRNALWDLTEIDGIPDDRAFYQANARDRAIAFLAVRGREG